MDNMQPKEIPSPSPFIPTRRKVIEFDINFIDAFPVVHNNAFPYSWFQSLFLKKIYVVQ